MSSQATIAQRVVESILAQKLAPGERLGEQQLADLFGVSRTLVREALMQLQARGFVEVRSRKGWYVVEPSIDEARDAFAARRAVEAGMLRDAELGDVDEGRPLQSVVRKLRQHIKDEEAAIEGPDAAARAFLLADFHVCLADCLGHKLLADMLRDLTARTMLVATLYQSRHDARESCADHARIVAALAKGDREGAAELMLAHIGSVEDALGASAARATDPHERLRASLAPLARPALRAAK
jgi:DNA-binding GntR family transcriptional regulator